MIVYRCLKEIFFRTISEVYGAAITSRQPGLRVFLYHSISTENKSNNTAAIEGFRQQMLAIKEACVSSPASALKDISLKQQSGAIVSIDDGLSELYSTVCPLLNELDIPYILYISPGLLNDRKGKYLSTKSLKRISEHKNCTIGSHGFMHRNLKKCSRKEQEEEILLSKNTLEEITGKPITSYAYPYGAVTPEALNLLEEAGYVTGVLSRTGLNLMGANPFLLKRTEILPDETERMFELKQGGAFDWHQLRQADILA